jgi:hypothetical protein
MKLILAFAVILCVRGSRENLMSIFFEYFQYDWNFEQQFRQMVTISMEPPLTSWAELIPQS